MTVHTFVWSFAAGRAEVGAATGADADGSLASLRTALPGTLGIVTGAEADGGPASLRGALPLREQASITRGARWKSAGGLDIDPVDYSTFARSRGRSPCSAARVESPAPTSAANATGARTPVGSPVGTVA